ncbi:aspartate carbamoyltransferase regulatory subunit [Halobaculum sp. MBLA0147]|uniref:aspartate carbamoyltransferase regulatory subunit n=1 Tax=Halobaculum sp. MBLA0147 TaxID=3079934 RepID=UPI0035233FBF
MCCGDTTDLARTDGGEDRQLRVSKIRNGTVIDHVAAGQALNVLSLLDIDGSAGLGVSVVMNVPSDRLGSKDVVKVEDRELSQSEVDVLSLLAPAATVNIVREFEVVEKTRVVRPDRVTGVLTCPNSNCITNRGEPVDPAFEVLSDGVRCEYCDTITREGLGDQMRA